MYVCEAPRPFAQAWELQCEKVSSCSESSNKLAGPDIRTPSPTLASLGEGNILTGGTRAHGCSKCLLVTSGLETFNRDSHWLR